MNPENPFEPSRLPSHPGEPVLVNTSLTRTMGTLSIVFGSLLLLCGLCSGLYVSAIAMAGPAMKGANAQMQGEFQEERDKEIADLKAQEETAVDDAARDEIVKQRTELEAQPLPNMPDFSKMYGMGDQRVATFMGIDIGTAVVLNILLLVSGIGLLGLNNWARQLGVLVAALKIFRLVVLYSVFVFAIVPIMIGQMMEGFAEMAKMNPRAGAPPMPPQTATFMGTMWTVCAVATVLIGVIFPALCWYFLTRPPVRAACETTAKAEYQ